MISATVCGRLTGSGRFIEVQGTAEGAAFGRDELDAMLGLAEQGIGELVALQRQLMAIDLPRRPAAR